MAVGNGLCESGFILRYRGSWAACGKKKKKRLESQAGIMTAAQFLEVH